jgi:hypothetical protein
MLHNTVLPFLSSSTIIAKSNNIPLLHSIIHQTKRRYSCLQKIHAYQLQVFSPALVPLIITAAKIGRATYFR